MLPDITIINGPNLNLVGTREIEIYGNTSLIDYMHVLQQTFKKNAQIHICFTQQEHEIIQRIHHQNYEGLIINPGAYSHTSLAIADAIKSIPKPCLEVHISNIFHRETFRRFSYISKACTASITGMGLYSYNLAVMALLHMFNDNSHT